MRKRGEIWLADLKPRAAEAGNGGSTLDEVERRHVDDQALPPCHQGHDSGLGIRRPGNVQAPAQAHDNETLTYADIQLYTWHGLRPLAQ